MSESALWKLSLGDIIFKLNTDVLTGIGSTRSPAEVVETILAPWWGVKSRNELLGMLSWLLSAGHTSEYRKARAGTATEFQQEFIEQYANELDGPGLLAWDLARYVALVRWGEHAGMLSEQEIWPLLDLHTPRVQQTYKSWHEFAQHFSYGHIFWDGNSNDGHLEYSVQFLRTNLYSPWQQIAWTTPLQEDAALYAAGELKVPRLVLIEQEWELAAYQYLSAHAAQDPENPYVQFHLGVFAADHLGDAQLAEQYYRAALTLDSKLDNAWHYLVHLLQWRGASTSAIECVYLEWLIAATDRCRAFLTYATWLEDIGNRVQANMEYRRCIQESPKNYDALLAYGQFLHRQGEKAIARDYLQQALTLSPNSEAAQQSLNEVNAGVLTQAKSWIKNWLGR